MKNWLLALILAVPALAHGQSAGEAGAPESIEGWEAAAPADPTEPAADWLDSSHNYATGQAQALSEWMDSFFAVPNYEVELPESLLRIDFTTNWDQQDGINNNLRLRGKLQLPGLSRRLNLVFSDESGDQLDLNPVRANGAGTLDDSVGFLYEVSQGKRSRLDLTLGIGWNKLRPGIRYRYQGTLGEVSNYRLTQRLQYENSEGGYATSQVELNRALSENTIVRWNNKGVYGEETEGVEWLTQLSLFQRHKTVNRRHELGINYFGAINGFTDPDYVQNYRVGVLFRRQVYRNYLFLELEPAYNYRKEDTDDKRQFAWSMALRFSIALERDLDRKRNTKNNGKENSADAAAAAAGEPLLAPEERGSGSQPPPDYLPEDDDL